MAGGNGEKLKEEERQQDRRIFSLFSAFDLNNDSLINPEEFRSKFRSLNTTNVEAEVQEAMNDTDADGNGNVDLDEFYDSMTRETQKERNLREEFTHFDMNNDSYVDFKEFKAFLMMFGMSESEVKGLIYLYDKDCDGKLTYEEYLNFGKNGPAQSTAFQPCAHWFATSTSNPIR